MSHGRPLTCDPSAGLTKTSTRRRPCMICSTFGRRCAVYFASWSTQWRTTCVQSKESPQEWILGFRRGSGTFLLFQDFSTVGMADPAGWTGIFFSHAVHEWMLTANRWFECDPCLVGGQKTMSPRFQYQEFHVEYRTNRRKRSSEVWHTPYGWLRTTLTPA